MNIYDFDGTLYSGDSTLDFILYSLKRHPTLLRFFPGIGIQFCRYICKSIDKTTFKQGLYHLFSGYDAESELEDFWDSHQHKIFSWYPDQHRQEDIIISASPEFLLKPICKRLGIRHLIASQVDPKTGVYTGKNCWGPEKVTRLKDELGVTHCDKFYSDRYSDQPLADLADEAYLIVKGEIRPWRKEKDYG